MGHTRTLSLQAEPIHVPDEVLDDLRKRLVLTRWPLEVGNEDWYYGANCEYLQQLVDYWRTDFDWRAIRSANQHL